MAAVTLLFLVLTPGTIYYCRGYRFDFDKRKIVQTGGLFFHTEPRGAQIYVNGVKKKKTNFFFGSALIENLIPDTYEVEIRKEGFKPWIKTLEVEEKKATSAKNVFLLPEDIKIEKLSEGVSKFWVSPIKETLLVKEKEEEEGWVLKVLDPKTKVTTPVLSEEGLKKERGSKKADFEDIRWGKEEEQIMAEIKEETQEEESQKTFFVLNIKTGSLSFVPFPKTAKEISFDPRTNGFLFLKKSESGSFSLFKKEGEEEKLVFGKVQTFAAFGNNIYLLDEEGMVQKGSVDGDFYTLANSHLSFNSEEVARIKMVGSHLFITKGGTVFHYQEEERELREIRRGVSFLKGSPSGEKVVLATPHEMEVLFLKEKEDQPLRDKGERAFLARLSGEIKDLHWLNDDYLVFSEKPREEKEVRIKVIEIDNRDRSQTWNLAGFISPDIYFSTKQKSLFVLSEQRLFISRLK